MTLHLEGVHICYILKYWLRRLIVIQFQPRNEMKFWSKWSRLNESAWLKQTAMSFGTNLTRKALRDLPFVRTFHLWSFLTVPQLEVARSRSVGE